MIDDATVLQRPDRNLCLDPPYSVVQGVVVSSSFDEAMAPGDAERAYEAAVREVRATGVRVATGRFRAAMKVHSLNDGPVTIWLDSATRAQPRSG